MQNNFTNDKNQLPTEQSGASLVQARKVWGLSVKTWLLVVGGILILAAAGLIFWQLSKDNSTDKNTLEQSSTEDKEAFAGLLQLDPAKNYGNKYSDGILPVGDERYVTDAAKKGNVYLCRANFVSDQAAGATTRGPWFIGTTQWDINKKYAVRGSFNWEHKLTNTVSGNTRTLASNNLPTHVTGTFPVSASDPAYAYDRNPNTIAAQDFTYMLTANPSPSTTPNCMNGGEVGIMLTGAALFNAFDAGGRDAGAWEIQDSCEGHPQASGVYHYHTLSRCIHDIGVTTVIGFALDGFPITGAKVGDNNFLTTDDLDECHGIVSDIMLDGQSTKTYHYVMTMDFPYSASCFRGSATTSPAQHSGSQQGPIQKQGPPPHP